MYCNTGKNAYSAVSLDSEIAGATPHQLITLLYDGAINAMKRAEIYFRTGDVARRGEMISRAIAIIDSGLRTALDHEAGGEISARLEMLYEYISRSLLQANLNKSAEELPHLINLMNEMADTWKNIDPQRRQVNHAP